TNSTPPSPRRRRNYLLWLLVHAEPENQTCPRLEVGPPIDSSFSSFKRVKMLNRIRSNDPTYRSDFSASSDSRRGFPPAGSQARRCQKSCSSDWLPRKMLSSALAMLAVLIG